MKITTDISGLDRIASGLRNSARIRKEFSPYFKQASSDLFAFSIAEAPNDKGQLAQSIELRFDGLLTSFIGTADSKCPYAKFVYMGTKAHKIGTKNKKSLRFYTGGSFVFRNNVNHPGTKPNPYLLKTYELHENETIDILELGAKNILEGI